MLLSELLAGLPVQWLRSGDAALSALSVDERELGPGALYFALPGYYGDGHDRIAEALVCGASALVVSDAARVPAGVEVPVALLPRDRELLGQLAARFYGEPTRKLRTYGVTGTNGKTSVTYLLEHLLAALGERPAVMGTVSYRFGSVEHAATNTTPEALFVQRFAAEALGAGASGLVLEVSSHALALGRTSGLLFDAVGFTNLSHEHLDFHGDLASYRESKKRLFGPLLHAALEAGKQPLAVACTDGPDGADMLAAVPAGTRRLTVSAYDEPANADVTCVATGDVSLAGTPVRLRSPCGTWEANLPLLGDYNRANVALAAALAARDDPARWAAVAKSLASFAGVPGRLELGVPLATAPHGIFVDYAHTPDALARALEVLRGLKRGPVTVVVGAGGDRDRTKRPLMGRAAQLGAERVIITSDNPRSEPPERIVAEVQAGTEPAGAEVVCLVDRSEAIERAMTHACAGPVLVAGKGHERYQERHGIRHPFDDREEIRRALVGRRLGCSAAEVPLVEGWSAARLVAAAGGGLDEPERAAACWSRAILAEARLRHGGLLVICAVGAPSGPRAALLERATAGLGGSILALEVAEGGALALARALSALAPAHRGLVLWAGELALATDAARDAGEPDLLVGSVRVGEAARQRAPKILTWEQALRLDAGGWRELAVAATLAVRARLDHARPSRPIPVPTGLLRGAC